MNTNKSAFFPSPASVNRPDSFRSTRVWDSPIFRAGLIGGIIGAITFAMLGYIFTITGMPIPGGGNLASAGGFVVLSLASAGIILFALFGSLIALFHRG